MHHVKLSPGGKPQYFGKCDLGSEKTIWRSGPASISNWLFQPGSDISPSGLWTHHQWPLHMVTAGSGTKVWWKCPVGHSYVMQVNGDRAVINEDESRIYRIESPLRASDLSLVPSKPAEANRVHTVIRGDTLWEISKHYLGDGARFPEIKKLNNLSSNVIYTGWKLKIPD